LRRRSRRSRLDLLGLGFFFFTFGESFKTSDYCKFVGRAQVASQAPPRTAGSFDECDCPRGSLLIGLFVAPKRFLVDGLDAPSRRPRTCFRVLRPREPINEATGTSGRSLSAPGAHARAPTPFEIPASTHEHEDRFQLTAHLAGQHFAPRSRHEQEAAFQAPSRMGQALR
jgi:hypothetical protein